MVYAFYSANGVVAFVYEESFIPENTQYISLDDVPIFEVGYKYSLNFDTNSLERTEIKASESTTMQEKVSELEKENALLKAQIQAQADRAEFIEDCIAEMAMQVYSNV